MMNFNDGMAFGMVCVLALMVVAVICQAISDAERDKNGKSYAARVWSAVSYSVLVAAIGAGVLILTVGGTQQETQAPPPQPLHSVVHNASGESKIVFTAEGTDAVGFVVLQPVDPNGNNTGSLEIGVWQDSKNSTTLQVFQGGMQLAVQRNGIWCFEFQVGE
jgi:hypothetical protein